MTPVQDVWGSLALFSTLYVALLVLLGFFLRRVALTDDPAGHHP